MSAQQGQIACDIHTLALHCPSLEMMNQCTSLLIKSCYIEMCSYLQRWSAPFRRGHSASSVRSPWSISQSCICGAWGWHNGTVRHAHALVIIEYAWSGPSHLIWCPVLINAMMSLLLEWHIDAPITSFQPPVSWRDLQQVVLLSFKIHEWLNSCMTEQIISHQHDGLQTQSTAAQPLCPLANIVRTRTSSKFALYE